MKAEFLGILGGADIMEDRMWATREAIELDIEVLHFRVFYG